MDEDGLLCRYSTIVFEYHLYITITIILKEGNKRRLYEATSGDLLVFPPLFFWLLFSNDIAAKKTATRYEGIFYIVIRNKIMFLQRPVVFGGFRVSWYSRVRVPDP